MRGFNLIELLIVVAIVSVILAGIFAVFNIGEMNWYSEMNLVDLQQAVRQAMGGVARELRQAKTEPGRILNINSTSGAIEFYIPGFTDPIIYSLQNNQIIRQHPLGTDIVLANCISNLTFCCVDGANCTDCVDSSSLNIYIQANKVSRGRPLSFGLREQVSLRNE